MFYRLSEEKENTIYTWIYNVFNGNEIQKVKFDSEPTGGNFTLTYLLETTAPIAFDATAADIEAALIALTTIDEVVVKGDMPKDLFYVEFKGVNAETDIEMISCDFSLLDGVTSANVTEFKKGASGAEIEWSYSDEERSSGRPLIILNILPVSKEGSPATSYKETDTFAKHYKYTFSLTVDIISEENFWEYIEILERAVEDDRQRGLLETAGLYLRRVGTPVDLTATLTEHEHRVQIEFFFAYAQDVDFIFGEIEKVSTESVYTSDSGSEKTFTNEFS